MLECEMLRSYFNALIKFVYSFKYIWLTYLIPPYAYNEFTRYSLQWA